MNNPLKLKPAFKDYIWGGTRLRDDFGKDCDFEKVAESWELSCHEDGLSVIANGEHADLPLRDLIMRDKSVLGTKCEGFDRFPILVKLIDAADNLSIQVHPNDEQGAKDGDSGKTEMWYVVDCQDGAEIIYGFNRDMTREEFRARIKENTLLEAVNRVKVQKGDCYFIPAGTLHAIGKGIVIAEVQQSSNLTYRVYDYGRTGADGKPRELHIEKAVEVTNLKPTVLKKSYRAAENPIASCAYFNARLFEIDGRFSLPANETSFTAALVLDGNADINGEQLRKGETCFIPAAKSVSDDIIVTPVDKKTVILVVDML